jgi:hypothetical protein
MSETINVAGILIARPALTKTAGRQAPVLNTARAARHGTIRRRGRMSLNQKTNGAEMTNPERHKCGTCGYEWKHGAHGGHSCTDTLLANLRATERELEDAKKDAERYRYLRSRCAEDGGLWVARGHQKIGLSQWRGVELDSAIDELFGRSVVAASFRTHGNIYKFVRELGDGETFAAHPSGYGIIICHPDRKQLWCYMDPETDLYRQEFIEPSTQPLRSN